MFLTRKHLSRRTVLKGAGAAIALPLLDAMIPAGTALAETAAAPSHAARLRLLPARRAARPVAAEDRRQDSGLPVHPEAARAAARLRHRRQRPAQPGGRGRRSARQQRADVAERRAPAAAQARHRRRRHGRPDRGALSHERRHAAVDGDLRRAGRHDLVPHARSAAADGRQSAQGVPLDVRPGRDERGAPADPRHDHEPARLRAGVDARA